jgi:hypothetical protein
MHVNIVQQRVVWQPADFRVRMCFFSTYTPLEYFDVKVKNWDA